MPEALFTPAQPEQQPLSMSDVENLMAQPTQRHTEYEAAASMGQTPVTPHAEAPHADSIPNDLIDPDGSAEAESAASGSPSNPFDAEPDHEISAAQAANTGTLIARLIDSGFSFTASNFIAHNDKEYRATESQLDELSEAWGNIAADHNWNLPPEAYLALLYVLYYSPLLKEALNDKRLAELEARQNDMESRVSRLEHKQHPDGNAEYAD